MEEDWEKKNACGFLQISCHFFKVTDCSWLYRPALFAQQQKNSCLLTLDFYPFYLANSSGLVSSPLFHQICKYSRTDLCLQQNDTVVFWVFFSFPVMLLFWSKWMCSCLGHCRQVCMRKQPRTWRLNNHLIWGRSHCGRARHVYARPCRQISKASENIYAWSRFPLKGWILHEDFSAVICLRCKVVLLCVSQKNWAQLSAWRWSAWDIIGCVAPAAW